ncbi:MAG: class I tRNA ligase family protein [Candidatus Pacebacteria bacterium]|nr:class I tRNA ligase family protein [Candidatus Paceibacterota bacterium]MCF7862644.1 class I tRNA ligase family protein [Candidatus Paceibacterota bacterium]
MTEENKEVQKENIKSENAEREEKILEFWRENNTFEKSLKKESPKGHYVFYDGPPFATGLMHYGHILGSTVKDTIGRYKTMQGYYVPRKWGWDCHGLPIENIVEKDLGIAGHQEIEKLGIDKFTEYAKSKVLTYASEWKKSVERIGRWVDFDGGYKTMDNSFMESVWWALSEMNKKDLIYEGTRVLAYCARCETPIANSEIAMDNSYKDIADISVYAKFALKEEKNTYLIVWTTTPWTLPGNTAIVVNKDFDYIKFRKNGEEDVYIVSKEYFEKILQSNASASNTENNSKNEQNKYEKLGELKGADLIGKKYTPVFSYYEESMKNEPNIWQIWHADFVTTDKGTAIAHQAPAFGEEDMDLARANKIPWILHVDETGKFKKEVLDFAGMFVKPKAVEKDGHQVTDVEIVKYLAHNNKLFAKEKINHSYPHCMRCDTPIIYYALPSWFININKTKDSIIKNAKYMSWVPAHLKDGRFKNIVDNAPDWNISRNRYFASPLPVWKCTKCEKQHFVSSLEDLKKKGKKSGNKYFVMRHGQADSNQKFYVDSDPHFKNFLTEKGKEQVKNSAPILKDKKITMIVSSDLPRARETAEILADTIGFKKENIIFEPRLREIDMGIFEGKSIEYYHQFFKDQKDRFLADPEGGESQKELFERVGDFLYDFEDKYKNENIVFVSHGDTVQAMYMIAGGFEQEKFNMQSESFDYFNNAEIRALDFVPLPHNKARELDLHRPYIDNITLICDCGAEMQRITEVIDCWFESSSMPFAQDHFPFSNKDWKKNNFPAGFVAEYIAQTRTWFYYTHVVSSILFDHAPFKYVVTTGTVRAEDGQKMSKSKGNFEDPWILFDRYGVDALRMYLLAGPLMKGEDADFSEKAVQDISSKIVGRLFNVLAFYELYRDRDLEKTFADLNGEALCGDSKNVLDIWIVERLRKCIKEVTSGMEEYDMNKAIKPFENFVDELSTWYLRRSRERIKDGELEAKQTLYFVLKNFAKILAPFAPFSAESIWLSLKNENEPESIHLTEWPRVDGEWMTRFFNFFGVGKEREKVLANMDTVRDTVSLGFEARQKAGIKVRQPLSKIVLKNYTLSEEYNELIKDELNIKDILVDLNQTESFFLDTKITSELKKEGDYREFLRAVQDLRKKINLVPSDVVAIKVQTDPQGMELIKLFQEDLQKTAGAKELSFAENNGEQISVGEMVFKIEINKI